MNILSVALSGEWLSQIFDKLPQDLKEECLERMAIYEYEANMPRTRAEIRAVFEAAKKNVSTTIDVLVEQTKSTTTQQQDAGEPF